MPPAMTVDQELILKKRARRRLVGAVALILLLSIILPIVLKDRVQTSSNEHATIVMNDENEVDLAPPEFEATEEMTEATANGELQNIQQNPMQPEAIEAGAVDNMMNDVQAASTPKPLKEDLIAKKVAEIEQQLPAPTVTEKTVAEKSTQAIASQQTVLAKQAVIEKGSTQSQFGYTIQVGAFSDLNNMKQIQATLAKAGFTSTTEKITTPKGDSVRLMTGYYATRESANEALLKLKTVGVEGIVKSKSAYDKTMLSN